MADPDLRCSLQSRHAGADPVGTAGVYDAYALVEVPLPWPREITEHPLLAEVVAAVAAAGVETRILGLVPDRDDETRHRVIVYRRPSGMFRGYTRTEHVVRAAGLGAAVYDALTSQVGSPAEGDGRSTTDVLFCTHGKRDRCCGSFGMNLYTAVGARHVCEGVRTWRVSHTGGHRFAPTAIFLPEGHMWAWLDPDLVAAILHRSVPAADLLGHYRGSSAIGSAPVQVAEREAFRREGWAWLDTGRRGTEVERNGDRIRVRLDFERPDRRAGAFEAEVEQTGTIIQPACGLPPGDATKSDPVWALRRFVEVDPIRSDVPSG
jgi:hypothetical protein